MEPRLVIDLTQVALGEREGLKRIPLVKLGRWYKGGRWFTIAASDVAAVVRNFRKKPNGEVVIDYEHASENPEVAAGGPVPASGWLQAVEDQPDSGGILWGLARFTDRARELIQAGEYKYISPFINWGVRDKETGEPQGATLTSVALVNRPFLDGLPAVRLSEAGWEEESAVRTGGRMPNTTVKLTESDGSRLTVVCGECGKETSAEAPKPKVVKLSDVARKDGRYDFAGIERNTGALVASEVVHAMQAQAELDQAVKDGKITPAQRGFYEKAALSDLAGFREFLKTIKTPAVALGEHGFAGDGETDELAKIDGQLDHAAQQKMAADNKLGYPEAVKLAASENPTLAARRRELVVQRYKSAPAE